MIVVTGGAGFIGSNLVAALEARGERDIVVVDRFGADERWRNLAKRDLHSIVPPERMKEFVSDSRRDIGMIFHMGAISSTTERNVDLIVENNWQASLDLWNIACQYDLRLVYASSAATYGAGEQGFDDDARPEALARLSPLNPYAWSKHLFDRRVMRLTASRGSRAPQWAGLKFFNVYGPNEYHKGHMVSVVKVKHDELAAGQPARLFRSDVAGLADGQQRRDFIWVGDVVDVMLWLLDNPAASGLFNLGTGQARTYLDLAHAVCDAAGQPRRVEFVDMPQKLIGQYQSFTQASMDKLRTAGFNGQFTPLEEGIRRYVHDYLASGDLYA